MAKKKNRLPRYLIIATVVLIIVAVIGKKAGWFGGEGKIKVAVEKITKRTIIETVSASGKIQPEVEVKISPDVSGEIVQLTVKEGDKVRKGQLLCKIRPDVYESYLDRANAALNNSKASLANAEARFLQADLSFKRNQKLYVDKVISDAEFESARSSYQVARAEVDAAKFNVKSAEASVKESKDNLVKTTIFSPVDGTVSKLNVESGERVVGTTQMAGTEIMRIANLSSMEVSVDVNENDINRLSLGDTATIEVDAFLDKKFKGIVTEIANSASIVGTSADQVTNFPVKIRILPESYGDVKIKDSNLPSPFRPGLSATVEIMTERLSNIITVPIQAVTTREDSVEEKKTKRGGPPEEKKDEGEKKKKNDEEKSKDETAEYVFIFDKDKAKKVKVTTGIQDDMYIEIKSGLKENEEVITAPYLAISKRLKDGATVQKVDKDELFKEEKK
jgi:HlyD family secretion protein